jgi:hypothetical protein
VTNWVHEVGSVYRARFMGQAPEQVFIGAKRLAVVRTGAPASLRAGEWTWVDDFLYVHSEVHPSLEAVEATRRGAESRYGILVSDQNHITVEGFRVERFTTNVLITGNRSGSSDITIRDSEIVDAYRYGVLGWDDRHPNNNISILRNLVAGSGSSGIKLARFGNGGLISGNHVTRNGQLVYEQTLDHEHEFRGGIVLWGREGGIENTIIERNTVEFTGFHAGSIDGSADGIWLDRTLGGNVVRYNVVRGNTKCGILVEDVPGGGAIHYNVVWGNGHPSESIGFGVLLMRDTQHWNVFNNTIVQNANGIGLGDWVGDGVPDLNVFKNNLVYANRDGEIHVVHGAEERSNRFGPNLAHVRRRFVTWGHAHFDTIEEWETAAHPVVSGTVGADPLFVDREGGDFRLMVGSLCVQAGVNVGLERDLAGVRVSNPPSLGAYELSASSSSLE